MRHSITLLLLLCSIQSISQIPLPRRSALVVKAAGTWCAGCGDWGWRLQEAIKADQSGSNPTAVVLNAYSGASSFLNPAGQQLSGFASLFPNWGINNIPVGPYVFPDSLGQQQFRLRIKQVADSFAVTAPVASVGFTSQLSGRQIEVRTRTKFWQAAQPDYFLAVYVIEDSLLAFQEGHPDGVVVHNDVVRGEITGNTFGDYITSDTITANAVFDKRFQYVITDSSWNPAHLHFVAVIWKRASGGHWDMENLSFRPSDVTAVPAELPAAAEFRIAPNPAANLIRLSFDRAPSEPISIAILDAVGRQAQPARIYNCSGNILPLDISALSAGTYLLQPTVGRQRLRPQVLSVVR